MERILIFDPSPEKREELMVSIRTCLENLESNQVEFRFFHPEDVFTRPMPKQAQAAFFTLSGMYDAEAARLFNRLREDIPLVAVSDSEDYGVESWRLGARYYLKRPFSPQELGLALGKCAP